MLNFKVPNCFLTRKDKHEIYLNSMPCQNQGYCFQWISSLQVVFSQQDLFKPFHSSMWTEKVIIIFYNSPEVSIFLKLKLKLSLNLLKKTNLWNIKSSHSRSKNLTRWNVKISYTSLKRTILFPWKGFLYLSEKVTISAKCFIFKVFERALNTPQNFFYVLAKLNKAIVTATFQKYSAAKRNKVSNLKVLLCSNTGK